MRKFLFILFLVSSFVSSMKTFSYAWRGGFAVLGACCLVGIVVAYRTKHKEAIDPAIMSEDHIDGD